MMKELSPDRRDAITRVIADPNRYRILQQIAGVSSLPCALLDMKESLSPATISHHLKELQGVELIETRREGRYVLMTLRRDTWEAYLRALAAL